jgi:hypothetical protein
MPDDPLTSVLHDVRSLDTKLMLFLQEIKTARPVLSGTEMDTLLEQLIEVARQRERL